MPGINKQNNKYNTMKPNETHEHNEMLCRIATDAVRRVVPSFYCEPPVYTLLHFTPDLKVATCLESHRRESGTVELRRRWTVAEVMVAGVRVVFRFPRRLTTEGYLVTTETVATVESLVQHIHAHRPRKPLPLVFDNPKAPVTFTSMASTYVDGSDDASEWTDPARPVSAVNTMLKRWGLRPLTTDEGNAMLSNIDEALAEYVPSVRWIDDMVPSMVYNTDRCDKYSSCMKGCDPDWFELYDDFHREDRLKMIGIYLGSERVGRALVWVGENPADLYLDRVYAPGHRCTFDPAIVREMQRFCGEEGITKAVFSQTAEHFGLDMLRKFRIRVPGIATPDNYDYFPYCDSMWGFGWDGWLRNYETNKTRYAKLQNTDGTAEGAGDGEDDRTAVTAGSRQGEWFDEDDTRWISRVDETYHRNDVTHSDYLDEWVVDDDSVTTYNGHLIWSEDATELHDGEYARNDDPDLVQLGNGEWAIEGRDMVVTLHDGRVVLYDGDLDYTTTVDGEYAMRDECVEVDGVWYLQGHEPAEETETEEAIA